MKPEWDLAKQEQTKRNDWAIADQWGERGRETAFPAFGQSLGDQIRLKRTRLSSRGESVADALYNVEPHSDIVLGGTA